MARIRTIKPDFFTSEDIVALSPLARLLYIALWCEADREGRLAWRPGTFKLRYFPADKTNIDALARELIERGLVIQYGDGLAYIPTFSQHQHVNPREANSSFPVPDASARVTDAQVGREGKEGKGKEQEEVALRLPEWLPSEAWKTLLEARRNKKLPNTPRVLQAVLTELERLKSLGNDPERVLLQSAVKGWKDVYPLKPELVAVSSEPKSQLCDYCSKASTGAVNGRRACGEHWQLAMDNEKPAKIAA